MKSRRNQQESALIGGRGARLRLNIIDGFGDLLPEVGLVGTGREFLEQPQASSGDLRRWGDRLRPGECGAQERHHVPRFLFR